MTCAGTDDVLRLSEERYRALVTAIAEIVWTTDARGQVIEDQPGWRAFSGQTSEEIKGAGWLAALHPESRENATHAWTLAVARNSAYETEWRLRRRDGDYRVFAIHATPVRTSSGAVREWIGCNIDITDHQRQDEELRRLHARTSAAVAHLERQGRGMQILKNLGDTLQACNSRDEAYPFIALAATELFPGARGGLAIPAADARELLATVIEWGDDSFSDVNTDVNKSEWMKPDFAIEDCWALRRGILHESGSGTICHHFRTPQNGPSACLPLAVRGQVVGLLSVRLPDVERLDAVHLDNERRDLISSFGNALALGLSTLQLRETLQNQP